MKNKLKLSVVALFCAIVSLISTQTLSADIEIVYFGGAHLPIDTTSPSWTAASNNRIQQIRNQLAGTANPIGTDKQLSIITAMDYSKMVVTTADSWNGVLAPGTGEKGNRYHVAFGIFSNGGSTFLPSDVTLSMQAYLWDSVLGYVPQGSKTSTNLGTVNNFRIRMSPGVDGINGTGDDVPAGLQSGTIASTGFIFGGQGKGYTPFGSGSDQDKINNTIAWMQTNQIAIKYTCQVGEVLVEKWVYNKYNTPQPAISGTSSLNWKSIGEPVRLSKSIDMNNWTAVGDWIWKREGTDNTLTLSDYPSEDNMFYRLINH